jgi:exopolyphosphatase/guanosine-5'-triphosphate,3'-diphosphate pyrophosphatase
MSVAAIDVGSNSVRLLVNGPDGAEVARGMSVTALGTGLERTGSFDAAAYDATVRAMERFASTIAELGVEDVRAVATSASRDAHNGAALMADIGSVLGVEPTIIDGEREASLSFMGATQGLVGAEMKLVIDIGGGSTEFVHGVDAPSYSMSVDMGSVRLTDRCFDRRPATDAELSHARADADAAFAPVAECSEPETVIAIGGTFTSLAAMALHLDTYDPDAVEGSTLDLSVVSALVTWLSSLSVAETALIPSLEPARARVILGGSIVAERSLVHCGLDAVTVSSRGVLDGLAAEDATP